MEGTKVIGSSICPAGDKHQLDFSLDLVFLSRNIIAIFALIDFLDSSVVILLFDAIFPEVYLTSRSNYEWFTRLIPLFNGARAFLDFGVLESQINKHQTD
jgi:hypothetical protein